MISILLSSSILILVVTLARLVLRRKVSQRLIYGLWLLVALRLLIPVEFGQWDYSFSTAARPAAQQVQQAVQRPISGPDQEVLYQQLLQEYMAGRPQIPEQTAPVSPEVQTQLRQEAQDQAAPSYTQLLKMVWLAGMVGMALWFGVTNLVFFWNARKGSRPMDAGSRVPVRVCPHVPSPCLVGFFRPVICLTTDTLEDDTQLAHILAHEEAHLRHADPLWSLVRCLCLCVYWFNPLVWMAALLSKRDCELACDEAALEALGDEARIPYGKTLMQVVIYARSPAHIMEMATSMGESKNQLKERLQRIVKKQKTVMTAAVALILICSLAAGCAFSGASVLETPGPSDEGIPPQPSEGSTAGTTVPNVLPCLVRINGHLYQDMGPIDPEISFPEYAFLGHITSVVSMTQRPEVDDQANYGTVDAPYVLWGSPDHGLVYVLRVNYRYSQVWHMLLPVEPLPQPEYPRTLSQQELQQFAQQLQGYWVDLSTVRGPASGSGHYIHEFMWLQDLELGFATSYSDNIRRGQITEVTLIGEGQYEVYYLAPGEEYPHIVYMKVADGILTARLGMADVRVFTYICQAQGTMEDTLAYIGSHLPEYSPDAQVQALAQQLQGYWVDLSRVNGPWDNNSFSYPYLWFHGDQLHTGLTYSGAGGDSILAEVEKLSDTTYELLLYSPPQGSDSGPVTNRIAVYTLVLGENTVTLRQEGADEERVYTFMCADQGDRETTHRYIEALLLQRLEG